MTTTILSGHGMHDYLTIAEFPYFVFLEGIGLENSDFNRISTDLIGCINWIKNNINIEDHYIVDGYLYNIYSIWFNGLRFKSQEDVLAFKLYASAFFNVIVEYNI